MSTYVGRLFSAVSSVLEFNAATLTGAMDIIAILEADGKFSSTPFHVRFGKFKLLKPREKLVQIWVNGEKTDLTMKLGSAGEAYFVVESDEPPDHDMITSPPGELSDPEDLPLRRRQSDSGVLAAVSSSLRERIIEATVNDDHELLRKRRCTSTLMSPSAVSESLAFYELESEDPTSLEECAARNRPWEQSTPTKSSRSCCGNGVQRAVNQLLDELCRNASVEHSINLKMEISEPDDSAFVDDVVSESVFSMATMGALDDLRDNNDLSALVETLPSTPQEQPSTKKFSVAREMSEASGLDNALTCEPEDEGRLLAFSNCRHLLAAGMTEKEINAIFEDHRLSYSDFATQPHVLYDPNVLFRLQDRLVDWRIAAPMIISMLAFGAPLDMDRLEQAVLSKEREDASRKERESSRRRSGYWFGFGRANSGRVTAVEAEGVIGDPVLADEFENASEGWKKVSSDGFSVNRPPPGPVPEPRDIEIGTMNPVKLRSAESLEKINSLSAPPSPPNLDSLTQMGRLSSVQAPSNSGRLGAVTSSEKLDNALNEEHVAGQNYVRKSLRPTQEQFKSLKLKPGPNTITFVVVYNNQQVSSKIFLWPADTKLVISDVDGTITRSDVLGHLLPRVGRDWSQAGVAGLFNKIESSGYRMMYLTSRPIGQAGSTRAYLDSLRQGDGFSLPLGPIVMSPDRLVKSLTREMILRRPHEFKIAALQEIRDMWPEEFNPFYAGFGNRITDSISYNSVGIQSERIFTVNPRGELTVMNAKYEASESYTNLKILVECIFPDISGVKDRESIQHRTSLSEFNGRNFWKAPLPKVDLSDVVM